MAFTHTFIYEFVTLFVVLDPVATVPVFLAVTAGLTRGQSLRVTLYALGVSFAVLVFFIAGGQFLLDALKIPMASFQLAGSLVLLLYGLKLVLGQITQEAAEMPSIATMLERAIYPLAIPGIAGAGSILTVVMLTDNNVRTITEQATTTLILAICLVCFFGLLAAAKLIFRILGKSGVEIVSRVFGLIISSIAMHGLTIAIKLSFNLV